MVASAPAGAPIARDMAAPAFELSQPVLDGPPKPTLPPKLEWANCEPPSSCKVLPAPRVDAPKTNCCPTTVLVDEAAPRYFLAGCDVVELLRCSPPTLELRPRPAAESVRLRPTTAEKRPSAAGLRRAAGTAMPMPKPASTSDASRAPLYRVLLRFSGCCWPAAAGLGSMRRGGSAVRRLTGAAAALVAAAASASPGATLVICGGSKMGWGLWLAGEGAG